MAGAQERPQAQQAFDVGSWPAIRQSAAQLSRNRDAFVRQLHYDITGLIPELADAQAPDMWAFCERMAQSLLWVALTDQPLGVVADALRRVGGQNWADGFPDTQYPTIAHALVQTVHYLSGSDWSASTGSEWIGYFMWIKPHLLAGAQQAAAQYATAQQEAEPSHERRQRRQHRTGSEPPRRGRRRRGLRPSHGLDDQKPAPRPPPPHPLTTGADRRILESAGPHIQRNAGMSYPRIIIEVCERKKKLKYYANELSNCVSPADPSARSKRSSAR
jgi:hypothetical protein